MRHTGLPLQSCTQTSRYRPNHILLAVSFPTGYGPRSLIPSNPTYSPHKGIEVAPDLPREGEEFETLRRLNAGQQHPHQSLVLI